jgi:hypothetical protein
VGKDFQGGDPCGFYSQALNNSTCPPSKQTKEINTMNKQKNQKTDLIEKTKKKLTEKTKPVNKTD